MGCGLGVEKDTAENTEEPEHILILQPSRAAVLVDLHAQAVAGLLEIRRQVKVRGGEAVLGIAHELSVEPEVKRLLHSLKGDADRFSQKRRGQIKLPYIAAHRRVVPVDLGRTQRRMAVPRVQRVDVLDLTIALQLDVARHLNGGKI